MGWCLSAFNDTTSNMSETDYYYQKRYC